VTIHTRVDGQIEKIGFKEGQIVKEGDLLVQIDPRPFQAVLDQAVAKKGLDEAQLENSRCDLSRFKAGVPRLGCRANRGISRVPRPVRTTVRRLAKREQ